MLDLRTPPRNEVSLQEAMREIQLVADFPSGRSPQSPGHRSVVIGVTSPDFRDGKTTTAIALGGSLTADLGVDVTIVDLDFETASVGREFGIEREPGIADVLRGTQELPAVVHRPEGNDRLSVVATGVLPVDSARLARSERLAEVVDEMRGSASFVICDLPAVLRSMTAPVLAQRCDAVIVVARSGRTTRAELDRAIRLLASSNVVGVVLNRYSSRIPGFIHRALGYRD